MTDLPVPRPPAITTPPICGLTAARRSAVLIGPWPTMRESGIEPVREPPWPWVRLLLASISICFIACSVCKMARICQQPACFIALFKTSPALATEAGLSSTPTMLQPPWIRENAA